MSSVRSVMKPGVSITSSAAVPDARAIPAVPAFYVSLEDDIMRRFGGDRIKGSWNGRAWTKIRLSKTVIISRTIADVQKRVEGYNFDIRKHLVEYDDVVNKQREVIFAERNKILSGADLKANILDMVEEAIRTEVANHIDERGIRRDEDDLLKTLKTIFPVPADINKTVLEPMNRQDITDRFITAAHQAYEQKEQELGIIDGELIKGLVASHIVGSQNADKVLGWPLLRVIESLNMLRIIDKLWVEHLTAMEEMRLNAGFEGAAFQRDPLVVYKNKGLQQFQILLDTIKEEIVHTIFHVSINRVQAAKPAPSPMAKASGRENINRQPVQTGNKKPGRNDPCPCGSGKKYKHCCGK